MSVEIPATLETSIETAVTHHLRIELGTHGLLLNAAELESAEATNAARGRWLLARLLAQCYPDVDGLEVQIDPTADMARIASALAFGAVTSLVLAGAKNVGSQRTSVEYLCGVFNLAIGLVDGICDGDTAVGQLLLSQCHEADLVGAAEERRDRGWLHRRLLSDLHTDDAVVFTATVIETFFANLHDRYDDEPAVRRHVGKQLADALRAETDSVRDPFATLSHDARIECSRATSVLPFEIISTMTVTEPAPAVSSGATMLGEAMWRVDDLVDLIDDVRHDALNAVLLAACRRHARYDIAGLATALGSSGIAAAATEAALRLRDGLQTVGAKGEHQRAYLAFVQRYAGVSPTL